MLSAGKLRHRVLIQRPVEVQDDQTGAVNLTWVDVAKVWAAIEPISVREFIAADVEDSKITTRITIRYRKNLDHSYRFYHEAQKKYYDIHGILFDKESGLEYITLPCSEGLKYQEGQQIGVPVNLSLPEIGVQS